MDWLICIGAGFCFAALLVFVHFFSRWADEASAAGAYRRKDNE